MTGTITPNDFSEIRWRGHWVWSEPAPQAVSRSPARRRCRPHPEPASFFRKTFALAQVPLHIPARITADSRYLLFVNGQEAYRGPIRGQPRRLTYDMLDLAPYLKPGENTVAIFVVYYGKPRSYWMPAALGGALGRPRGVCVRGQPRRGGWLAGQRCQLEGAEERCLVGGFGRTRSRCTRFSATRSRPRWWTPAASRSAGSNPASTTARGRLHHTIAAGGPAGSGGRAQPPTDPYGPLHPRQIAKLGGELRIPSAVRAEYLAGQITSKSGDPVKRLQATLDLTVSGTGRQSASTCT